MAFGFLRLALQLRGFLELCLDAGELVLQRAQFFVRGSKFSRSFGSGGFFRGSLLPGLRQGCGDLLQSGALGREIRLQTLQFSAALRFELRFRLLCRGEELVDGCHFLLRGRFLGGEFGDRSFTVLVLLVGLGVQGLQALLRGAQVFLGLGDKDAGGFEFALDVAQISAFDVELAGIRLRIFNVGPCVLHLAAQFFELALEAGDLSLRLGELFFADVERGIQGADLITPLLLHVVFSPQGIALLAELFGFFAQFGSLFGGRWIGCWCRRRDG